MRKRSHPKREDKMKDDPLQIKAVIRDLIALCFVVGVLFLPTGNESRGDEMPGLSILPVFAQRGTDPAKGAICPVCKRVQRAGEVAGSFTGILTQKLYERMEALGTFNVMPLEKVEEVFSKSDRRDFGLNPVSVSVQMGRELGADFVMVGLVFRCDERVGSSWGVEKPASVAFHLHVIRIRDGAAVWDGRFDETQKALFDNLLQTGSFLRRKAHWLTAAELAEVGMDELLKKLPEAKELQEKP
jgi:hypothetical protein